MANGDLNIVRTPFQASRSIVDSPEIAYADMIKWGKTPSPEWARYYAENSQTEIYPWLTSLGVEFTDVLKAPDNSVPRIHLTKGRGIGLVRPVYVECLKLPNIVFQWNARVTRLTHANGRINGVQWQDVRTGKPASLAVKAVVLATGGFQSNLDMVREYWASGVPFPENFLSGSGINSTGTGHKVASAAGAALVDMDRQMNLSSGIRDPRYPDRRRGPQRRQPRRNLDQPARAPVHRRIPLPGNHPSTRSCNSPAQPTGPVFDAAARNPSGSPARTGSPLSTSTR
jgi:predicted oxidoreductase